MIRSTAVLLGPMLVAALAACTEEGFGASGETRAQVQTRGARVLAMDVGPAESESLDTAVAKAKAVGVTTVVLNYDWNQLEPAAFQYQSAKLLADNAYYSTAPHAMSVVLNIRPLAGACRVVPPDLMNLAWNDPVMIARFGYLLIWIRGHLPNVSVRVMSIGTEIDSHLALSEYPAYKTFFEAARQNAKAQWGQSLPVGTAVTWDGLTSSAKQGAILDLNERADHVLYTYYGLTFGAAGFAVKDPYAATVADTYAALYAVDSNLKTRGRTVDLIEAGYPSSPALSSSEAKQQTFVSTVFGIWDAYSPRISTVVFNWQTDLSEYSAQVVAIGGWGGGCQAPAGSPPPTPAAPSVTAHGPTGTRTWSYYVVASNASGSSQPSSITTIHNGAATLSASQFHRVTWAPVTGATSYKVMRFASGGTPASTGLIATVSGTAVDDPGLASSTYNFQEFLRTLGLRTNTAPVVDKPAFTQLATEAHARGW